MAYNRKITQYTVACLEQIIAANCHYRDND